MASPAPAATSHEAEDRLTLYVAVVIALAITIWVNLHKSMWLDEASTLRWTGTSLDYTIQMSEFRETKPPLYFLLLYYWRKLASGIEFSRGLSTLCLALTVVYFHRLSGLLGIGRGWWSLGLVAALTPQLLWAGTEARVYALATLCVVSSMYYFTRVQFTGTEHPWRDSALFVLCGYAGLLTFYYNGFILAALFCAGLFGRDFRRLVWSGVALCLLMFPWIDWVRANVFEAYPSYLRPVDLGGPSLLAKAVTLTAWSGQTATRMVFRLATPLIHRDFAKLGLLLVLVGLLVARVWTGRPRWSRLETAYTIIGLVGFGLLAVIRLTNASLADERHWIVTVPGLIILPSLLASRVVPGWPRRVAGGVVLAVFGLAAVSFARNERGQIDWRGPASLIAAREQPGEPIVIYDQDSHPFEYYYKGINRFSEVPYMAQAMRSDSAGVVSFSPAEVDRLRRILAQRDPSRNSFWIVEGEKLTKAVEVLSRQLGRPLQVLQSWQFHRTNVHHVALDTAAH